MEDFKTALRIIEWKGIHPNDGDWETRKKIVWNGIIFCYKHREV